MVWETPDILPWASWIARWLENASYLQPDALHPVPISQDQELALWEEIIRSSSRAQGLMYLGETARQVRQAWILFRHWNLEKHHDPQLWVSPDQEAFLEWSRQFQDRLDSCGWLEEARQPEYVAWLLANKILSCPKGIILAGFEQLSPVQEHILGLLQDQAGPVYALLLQGHKGRVHAVPLADRQQEMLSAALWTRKHLQISLDQRIGIIVPDLSQVRQELMHTFDSVLHPEAQTSPLPPQDRIYDISLGQALYDYPLVQAALHILDLGQNPLPFSTISALLTSPFLAGAKREFLVRGGLEAAIRDRRETAVAWQHLLRLAKAGTADTGPSPLLAQALSAFQARWRAMPGTQPPSAWAQSLDLLLQDMGWPGEQSLRSEEFQTVQAWQTCLQRLAAMERIIPEMTLDQARSRLQGILGQTIFQPERPNVQVQIMGMLEAVGERFERIWVMGLSDQIWPPSPEPNPFLPAALQRRLDMPRSSPEHELLYARKITDHLKQSAARVMLSYPLREEDRDLLPSPLIQGVPSLDHQDLHLGPSPDPWLDRSSSDQLEYFQDEQGPGLPIPSPAPGGSSLLRAQAACPFQGFARHRLGAKSPEGPVPGLGPPERGTIMHSALEYFWQTCRDQATLLSLSLEKRSQWISTAVQQAIKDLQTKRPLTMSKEFVALEAERLQNLLQEWLELEALRSPFQVHALEKRFDICISGLQLNVMVDRLDRLENGKLLVIDYKAGRHSMSEWFQERPVEPQVPLYSLFCPEPVAGVYFGVVRKGQSCFVGLGQETGIVPGCLGFAEHKLTKDFAGWEDLLAAWRTSLEALAGEYVRGEARVEPSSPQACRQCDLHSLCRVFELQGH